MFLMQRENYFYFFSIQFSAKPKLGGDELASNFLKRIESSTTDKLQSFKAENERKRQAFIVSLKIYCQIQKSTQKMWLLYRAIDFLPE